MTSQARASKRPARSRLGAAARQLRSPARVLTVMDQPVLAEVIRLALSHGPFQTRTARTEVEAMAVLQDWHPQLVIVDMDLGKGRVLDELLAAGMRSAGIPFIALTRRGDLRAKLEAFERGADDILTVPLSPEELIARTLAIMRRAYRETIAFTPVIKLGELEVDILHRHVRSGGGELHLTSLEQSLLYLLAANSGQLVTREQILDNLWGVDYAAESNVIDRHVRNLRTKLHDNWRRPKFIATVPGRGYRFVAASAGTSRT
jgi:two-component system, OmpR family, alkaline phosphatase synthesis response regulator PhoP